MSTPSGRYSRRTRSFGEWMFDSGVAMPDRIVGMPLSTSAGTIGSVPPDRESSGLVPITCSNASSAICTAGSSGETSPGGAAPRSCEVDLGTCRRRLADQPLDGRGDRAHVLPGREPHREVRLRGDRDRRVRQPRLAAEDAVHVDRRLGRRAQVELVRRAGVVRHRARAAERIGAGRELVPARALLVGRRLDALAQRLGQASVARHDAAERLHQRVRRVQRRVAEHAGVKVARAASNLQLERHHAARPRAHRRHAAALHRRVEDDARVGAALVVREELDDRLPADLLLAVARDPQMNGQRTFRGEERRALQQRPELALVVGDAARVDPLVANRRLERLAVPELERRRRLHVEVAVDEDRRRVAVARRRGNVADDERLRVRLLQLRLPAGTANEVANPLPRPAHVARVLRIRADARNPQQLGKLVEPGLIHDAPSLNGSRAPADQATSRRICASASARSFFSVWFSICRMRSRVTLNVRPTSSSVRGCLPSSP